MGIDTAREISTREKALTNVRRQLILGLDGQAHGNRPTPLGILVAVAVTIVSVLGAFTAFEVSALWLLVGLSISICLTPFLLHSDEPRLFSPYYLTLGYLVLSYPIKFIANESGMEYVGEDYPGLFTNERLMTGVFAIFLAGVVAYIAGYRYPPRKSFEWLTSLRIPFFGLPTNSWPWRAMVVAAIGWGTVVLQIAIGTWGSFAGLGENWSANTNQLFSYLFLYVWFAYIAALLWLFSKNRAQSLIGFVICGLIIAVTFFASVTMLGSKTWLVYPIYWLLMAAYMTGRRPPIWMTLLILSVAIAFTFAFMASYRLIYLEEYGANPITDSSIFDVSKGALREGEMETASGLAQSAGMLLTRLGGVDNAAQVVSLFPSRYDYEYFYDVLLIPLSAIPRVIFPNKPQPQTPAFYSIEVAGMTSGGSAAPHPLAEGYINFGVPGVIVLFWVWGVIQALLYRGFYLPRRDNLIAGTLYGFYMLQFVGFGGWITGLLSGLLGQIIVLIPMMLILDNAKVGVRFAPSETR